MHNNHLFQFQKVLDQCIKKEGWEIGEKLHSKIQALMIEWIIDLIIIKVYRQTVMWEVNKK